jgi:hypothetical protein
LDFASGHTRPTDISGQHQFILCRRDRWSGELVAAAKNKTDPLSHWVISLQKRRGYGKAMVAIAAKNARMCWAVLQRGDEFKIPV